MASESTRYRIVSAEFLTGVNSLDTLPVADRPEVVFAGRSNSGKSTLLNALCGQRSLARVSKTPGRTQMINFFAVRVVREQQAAEQEKSSFDVYFVDLPGYGHADVPKAMQRHWSELLTAYLVERQNISVLALLSDCRRDISEQEAWFFDLDIEAVRYLILTKADKLSNSRGAQQRKAGAAVLDVPPSHVFLVSAGAKKKRGLDQLCSAICHQADGE